MHKFYKLRLLRLLEILNLHSEGVKLLNRLPSLLRIPLVDVLLLQLLCKSPDVASVANIFASLQVFHGEELVVLAAHMVEAEVHGGTIGDGS